MQINGSLLSGNTLLAQALHCLGVLGAYIAACVVVLLAVRFLLRPPSFVFRKLLHVVAFTCISLMVLAAESWQAAALASLTIAALAYPLLSAGEGHPWFSELLVEKSPGEITRSMLMLFLMFAALIAACWGVCGQPRLCATAILMWGTGDAAAALVGIPYGRHKVQLPLADGKKSWEGSTAMLLVSFASGLCMLVPTQGIALPQAVLAVGITALLGTTTELFSPSEYDTVTVPIVMAALLLAFARIA